jgi:PAS domain S-box-containing protein
METHAVPMKNPGGEIISLLGVTMDVTDKRKAELELKENEEKYRTLVEQAVDAIALFDAGGKILDVNTGAVDLLGYSKKELIGMYLPDILTAKEIKIKPVRFDLLQKGDSTIKRRIMRKKDGSLVQTEVRSQQLPDGRFLSVIRDLTERIQAEKDLEDSYQAIRKLTSHIQNVREEERTSIAREIHDELGQQLTVMKMDVSWLKKEVGVKNESINIRLKELIDMLDETVKSVRRISAQLRPSLLDDLGLAAAMEWQLQEFEKRSGISTRFITSTAEIKLPVDINTALYRIFQESLTNVARHSKAKNVTVNLMEKNDQLILSIADDGKGFDKGSIANKKTLGILGMKERTSMIDGIYTIESIPDKGTVTTVAVSLTKVNTEQLSKINVEQ